MMHLLLPPWDEIRLSTWKRKTKVSSKQQSMPEGGVPDVNMGLPYRKWELTWPLAIFQSTTESGHQAKDFVL